MSRPLLIAGATGKQGGATIKALLNHASWSQSFHPIYAMTRDLGSASAKQLRARFPDSIKLVKGDLNDAAGAFKNIPVKLWGVFIVTIPQTKPKTEDEVGKALVEEAIKAGVSHIVFTSVERGSANGGFNRTNVPHFQTKHDIEAHLMQLTKDTDVTYTILRPVFFLDNLEWGFIGKVIATTWRDYVTDKLQVIDSADIGKIAANAFLQSDKNEYKNKAISLAGDDLSFQDANEIFKKKVGHGVPVTFGILSTLMMWLSHDLSTMFKFFNDPGYKADIASVKKLAPVSTFEQWLDKSSYTKRKA